METKTCINYRRELHLDCFKKYGRMHVDKCKLCLATGFKPEKAKVSITTNTNTVNIDDNNIKCGHCKKKKNNQRFLFEGW